MTELYFVRHGETENNQRQLMNGGAVDTPLTAKGVRGAKAVGQYLRQLAFKVCYVSPQKRAQTTAQLILAQSQQPTPPTVVAEGLREFDMGDWDGRPISDLPQNQDLDNYLHHPERWTGEVTGGESYHHLIQRGEAAINQIVAAYPHERVLVVSHGVLLQTTLNSLRGYPLNEVRSSPRLANCSVTIFSATAPDNYHCQLWNQTDFQHPLS